MTKAMKMSDKQLWAIYKWAMTPTLRERWYSFWRMYRGLRRKDLLQEFAAMDAARKCLDPSVRYWFDFMRVSDDRGGDSYATPLFIRLAAWKTTRYLFLHRKRVGASV